MSEPARASGQGGCLCGAIRYHIDGDVLRAGLCHCTVCRRASGAPLHAGAVLDRNAFSLVRGKPKTYRSSERGVRHFCGDCGTQLFFEPLDQPDHWEIGIATLDDPEIIRPSFQIWDDSRIAWLRIQAPEPVYRQGRGSQRATAPGKPRPASGNAPEGLEGGCLCGQLRYRLAAPLQHLCHCHCAMCRHSCGEPVVSWASLARKDLEVVAGRFTTYRSSAKAVRRFCGDCGTQIVFDHEDEADLLDISVGSLDRPELASPAYHIFPERRISWLDLDPHLPTREPTVSAS